MKGCLTFDVRRPALQLPGGDKAGQSESWYQEMVRIADALYDEHLAAIKQERASE